MATEKKIKQYPKMATFTYPAGGTQTKVVKRAAEERAIANDVQKMVRDGHKMKVEFNTIEEN